MDNITFIILKVVVSVATAMISAYLIPYLRNKIQDAKYASLAQMVKTAVYAAEQTIGGGKGELKKEEVVKLATEWLSEHGVKITEANLDALIESCVLAMKIEMER